METIISALIASAFVAIGWHITYRSNRKHEVGKVLLTYRLEVLHLVLSIWTRIEKDKEKVFDDPDFINVLEISRSGLQLYGYQDEFQQMEKFITCMTERDLEGFNMSLQDLIHLIRDRIRKELDLNPLNYEVR